MTTSTTTPSRTPSVCDQHSLLHVILEAALAVPDRPVLQTALGSALAGVLLDGPAAPRAGIASRLDGGAGGTGKASAVPGSAHALAGWLTSPPLFAAGGTSLGMAAVNALLPTPPFSLNCKGQDLILDRGRGAHVAVVGHFPFVERLGAEFASLAVLELAPRAGDVPASSAPQVLPRADVVAITGTTLLNGTLAGLLALCRPDAFVMLLGPSTPLAPALLCCGIDALAGAVVDDPQAALSGITNGLTFKNISGMRSVVLTK